MLKDELREAGIFYKDACDKNKVMYVEFRAALKANQEAKAEYRNKIADLRKEKKALMG